MQQTPGGHFADPTVEAAFRRTEREKMAPVVRIYAATTLFLLMIYAAVNPLFFDISAEIRFSILLMPTMLVLAGYFCATFWRGYVELPMIDFAALLGLGLLILGNNLLLWQEAAAFSDTRHANVAINNAIVGTFAAVALAGRTRWFAAWLGCHAAAFSLVLVLFEDTAAGRIYAALSYVSGAAIAAFLNWALGRAHRTAFALREALEEERAKTEELLYNVLPPVAAQRLKQGMVVADSFSDVSVVFIDVVGFTKLSSTVSPGHLIEMLNAFFRLADRCAAEHGVEKVKTIGDAYLAIAGGNSPAANSADAALAFAEAVIAGLDEVKAKSGIEIQVRIGVHSGPVVGGVIGATRMAYDYWGETMNVASRIEGQAQPNGIAVSEATFMRTRRKDLFDLPELVALKGVGEAPVFRLKKPEPPRIALAG